MSEEIKIVTISSSEKLEELADRMINLMNEYSGMLSGYELIGVIESVKQACHKSIEEIEEE